MKQNYIIDSPNEIFEIIEKKKTLPYVIKIKCLGCSETSFFGYEKIQLKNHLLVIGEKSYPIELIERITIRTIEKFNDSSFELKVEETYKVSSSYLNGFLSEGTKKLLLDLKLL